MTEAKDWDLEEFDLHSDLMGEFAREESGYGRLKGNAQMKQSHRRRDVCTGFTRKFLHRRAYSELGIHQAMGFAPFEQGKTYNFITEGDVDMLSFVGAVIARMGRLDRVLMATEVMAAEDVLRLIQWQEEGRIGRLDMAVGIQFGGVYKIEMAMVRDFYSRKPAPGWYRVMDNHGKGFAACNREREFYITVLGSSNFNTNPRGENVCVQTGKELYDFYTGYYSKWEWLHEAGGDSRLMPKPKDQQPSRRALRLMRELKGDE